MTISPHIASKLLEIKVLSAQDLPPVSKILRTYTAAWVHPDNKLTTPIDYHGHTNPSWNFRFVFRVDDKFLSSENSAITFEIFNVAWLRDLPVGTTRLLINNILPVLARKSPGQRSISLQICRPSGHLQGTLNINVNLVDNNEEIKPLGSDIGTTTTELSNDHMINRFLSSDSYENNYNQEDEKGEKIKMPKSESSQSENVTAIEDVSSIGQGSSINGSVCTGMRPLPSEVAANMNKGLYWTSGDDYGSSALDNWTAVVDTNNEGRHKMNSKTMKWCEDDDQILLIKNRHAKRNRRQRKNHSKGKGLFSCLGNACSFEFNFLCRKNNSKNKKLEKSSSLIPSDIEKTLTKFYI